MSIRPSPIRLLRSAAAFAVPIFADIVSRKGRSMGFRTAYLLPIVAAIAITAGNGQADTIKIDDLAEGVPTVQSITAGGIDNTATNVTIISSSPESIHFLWTSTDATQSDQISIDMLETDGTVSDRILITGNGTSIVDFLFASDPVPFPSQINP